MVIVRSTAATESSVDLTSLIKPSTSTGNLERENRKHDDKATSTCLDRYGPYPSSIPEPMVNKDGRTPSPYVMAKARDMWDLSAHPDHRDKGTPDEWIPRDGKLVRLTGRHPFNVEPPLSVHQRHKFITPACLHYVRNHGACPKLSWEEHRVTVGGIVPRPLDLGMNDIESFPPRELPVTLVCAGNRRKEQNMLRQTIGFNWGAGGVSTNVWRGVLLRDLLLAAGVEPRDMAGKHVEFIGVEDLPNKVGPGPFEDEPWGKLVKYGTSVPLSRAMNPAYDILVAYEANGERLQPDHGFPVRLIIPGYIGGRMIKWLAEINVLEHETKNHYHYHDNRILPPHVTAEESLTGGWWYKPEYIFNELNINSAITAPGHDETIDLAEAQAGSTYPVEGYAYTGGGRRITRLEVTIDGGINWELAEINQIERPTDYGMYWCWIWWKFDLKITGLVGTKEIWCRAWDESNCCQPNHPTWNLMGMGNNQCFRVKVHTDEVDGRPVFRFEHPTRPGQQTGGWMTKLADKPDSAGFGRLLEVGQAKAEPAPSPPPAPKARSSPAPPPKERICSKTGRKIALDPKRKQPFVLQKKTVLSRDSFELDFALQSPDHVLGLPTGKHVFLSANVDGRLTMRRYTPITSDHDVGCVKFVIKAYPPCERFPEGGKLSQYLDAMKEGETLDIRGPVGEFDYDAKGKFKIDHNECHATHFNMIAGGTGITPCMQIAAEILRNDDDETKVSLVFGARIEGDLLCRPTLDEWAERYPGRFRAHYILSDEWPEGWEEGRGAATCSTGFVGKALFEEVLYPAGDGVYNLMCGPPIMLERGCTPNLAALGHKEENIFSF